MDVQQQQQQKVNVQLKKRNPSHQKYKKKKKMEKRKKQMYDFYFYYNYGIFELFGLYLSQVDIYNISIHIYRRGIEGRADEDGMAKNVPFFFDAFYIFLGEFVALLPAEQQ